MILGVDLGNHATKTSKGIIFPSKISTVANILKNTKVETPSGTYYIGEGTYDTEYRKVLKPNIREMVAYAVAMSTKDNNNKIMVGLPLSQYDQDKEQMKSIILSMQRYDIEINYEHRKIYVDDAEVYPEGVSAIVGTPFEGIVVDIGGRTTDCGEVREEDGEKKVFNPHSIPKGTLNLYSDFVKAINARYCLDLKSEEADRILRKGLYIDGQQADYMFAIEVFRIFVDELINKLKIEYSLRTQKIALVGGGCELLQMPLSNRLPGAVLVKDALFATANGLERQGRELWL